jgi:ATP-dependent Clp protease protease subunit
MGEKWFDVKNKAAEKGEIYIYGTITDEKWMDTDVTPAWFKEESDKLKNMKEIDLFVNSGGGGVFAGLAIYNMIKRLTANVTAHIDGIAASTASWLIQAANKIVMPENALMMIHNPSAIAIGTADDMRVAANFLDKTKEVVITAYQRGKKLNNEKISDMMNAETWMNGKEAFDLGFVDVLEPAKNITSSIDNSFATINGIVIDVSKYKNFQKEKLAHQNIRNVNIKYLDGQKKLFNLNRKGAN